MEPKSNLLYNPCSEIRMPISNSIHYSDGTTSTNVVGSFLPKQNNIIMQNKVAVFQVVRDENDKIIKTEFIKELWIETKNGISVDFQVARDKDLAEYNADELIIKVIHTVTF